jgi:phospholipid/cholesterol/gamma-HCH transport system ATP-binding protein
MCGLDPITAKTVVAEIVKLRDLERVTSIVVTHQLPDAFYIATHEAVQQNGRIDIVPASTSKCNEAEFIMLKNGRLYFHGHAGELKRTADPYLRSFLTGWVPPLI